jgi:hypothetical protein
MRIEGKSRVISDLWNGRQPDDEQMAAVDAQYGERTDY